MIKINLALKNFYWKWVILALAAKKVKHLIKNNFKILWKVNLWFIEITKTQKELKRDGLVFWEMLNWNIRRMTEIQILEVNIYVDNI
jgi:hypothetical protein